MTKTMNKPPPKSKPSSSVYTAEPITREALAAEKRIQQKTSKKIKNAEARKDRTRDLLFGDGLKQKEEEQNDLNGSDSKKTKSPKSNLYKSDQSVPVNASSPAANAALARLSSQKNAKIINMKDRQKRTMDLMHGDLLKDQDEVKAAPRESTYNDDIVELQWLSLYLSL